MKKLLIISFDLIRLGDLPTSLSIASLMSYLKNQPEYLKEFTVAHHSFNLLTMSDYKNTDYYSETLLAQYDIEHYQFIAIACYVWSEFAVHPLMKNLRQKGFRGGFILGGYQISYAENQSLLVEQYPDCQYFISGYAEAALYSILTNTELQIKAQQTPQHLMENVAFEHIPSPYLTKELRILQCQPMVRMETKRGCPFRCSFCAHRDLLHNKVYHHSLDKVFAELSLFKERQVQKINVLDPIFNMGTSYIKVLQEAVRINLKAMLSLQTRFELIKGELGNTFITLCQQLNIFLEFGLQTAIEQESIVINRKNNMEQVREKMLLLKQRHIPYEVSLIYGLPTQTLHSFQQSLDFVYQHGATSVKAYPLMLLRGTELFTEKTQWGFKEEIIQDYDIPVVTSSHSFTKQEWLKMHALAEHINQLDGNNYKRV